MPKNNEAGYKSKKYKKAMKHIRSTKPSIGNSRNIHNDTNSEMIKIGQEMYKKPNSSMTNTMRYDKDGNFEISWIGPSGVGSTSHSGSTGYYYNTRKREQDIIQTKSEIEVAKRNRKGIKWHKK